MNSKDSSEREKQIINLNYDLATNNNLLINENEKRDIYKSLSYGLTGLAYIGLRYFDVVPDNDYMIKFTDAISYVASIGGFVGLAGIIKTNKKKKDLEKIIKMAKSDLKILTKNNN